MAPVKYRALYIIRLVLVRILVALGVALGVVEEARVALFIEPDGKMTRGKLLRYAIALIATILVGSCGRKILSRRDAMSLSAVVSNNNGKNILTVSGFSGDSSMGVYNISSEEHGDKLLIIVLETLIRKGLTGNFDYSVEIKENINYVCFGSLSDVIWRRE